MEKCGTCSAYLSEENLCTNCNEMVVHPNHYNQQDRKECWNEFIDKYGAKYTFIWCILTAQKYLYRKGTKLGEEEIKDLNKAKQYIQKAKSIVVDSDIFYKLTDLDIEMCRDTEHEINRSIYEYNNSKSNEKEKEFMEKINNE